MPNPSKQPAVFLDRDGTINVEKDYLYKVEDFAFIDGAPDAIRALKNAGFLVIVVTNQSGVARGYYGLNDVTRLHEHIQSELTKHNTAIDAFYVCPHHPGKGLGEYLRDCDCRKGAPGMLLQAAAEHNVDLFHSYLVGDKIADIEAAENAGCKPIMVMTGYGQRDCSKLTEEVPLCDDLAAAAKLILGKSV